MNPTRSFTTLRGRAVLWTLLPLPLMALGAYELIGTLEALQPGEPAQVIAVAPAPAPATPRAWTEAPGPTGLSADAEDAAKRSALSDEQPPTF